LRVIARQVVSGLQNFALIRLTGFKGKYPGGSECRSLIYSLITWAISEQSAGVRRVSQEGRDEECMGPKETSILVVEDHDETRRLLTASLSDEYSCTVALSADEAIRLIDSKHFDLAIIDIHVAGASGLEVCRLVSQMGLDTVIIAITGMTDLGYRLRATRQGVWYCLEKPIDIEKLLVYTRAGLRCQAIARLRHHGAPTSSNARGIVVN
jgi:CheY-like chemotaxis protein